MTPLELLDAAWAKIDTPDKHVKGMFASDTNGKNARAVGWATPNAKCFCMVGAIMRTVFDAGLVEHEAFVYEHPATKELARELEATIIEEYRRSGLSYAHALEKWQDANKYSDLARIVAKTRERLAHAHEGG